MKFKIFVVLFSIFFSSITLSDEYSDNLNTDTNAYEETQILAIPGSGFCDGSNPFTICGADTNGTEGRVIIEFECTDGYVTGVEIVDVYITAGNAGC